VSAQTASRKNTANALVMRITHAKFCQFHRQCERLDSAVCIIVRRFENNDDECTRLIQLEVIARRALIVGHITTHSAFCYIHDAVDALIRFAIVIF